MKSMPFTIPSRCALALSLLCSVASAAELRVALPAMPGTPGPQAALVLDVPQAWRPRVSQPGGSPAAVVQFTPAAGSAFKMLLTVLPTRADAPPPNPEALASGVASAAAKAAQRSVEPAPLAVAHIDGPAMQGSYFRATDRQPEPGGFRHLMQGSAIVGKALVSFTVLANDESTEVAGGAAQAVEHAALNMLRTARSEP